MITLTEEEAILVDESLITIISCTIGEIYDADPEERSRLEREIEVLHDVRNKLKDPSRHLFRVGGNRIVGGAVGGKPAQEL